MTTALDVFRYVLDLGGVLSTVGQAAAFALIRVVDNETWCWPKHADDEHGYGVGTIAGWIGKSKRHARRGLAELEQLGIGKRERRPWNTSRYHLFPEKLRELAILAKTTPAPVAAAPVLERAPTPAAEALQSAAEALGPILPSWADSKSKKARPADLARLAWCWASALYPGAPAEHAGLFAPRLERLRRQLDISAELLAERLIVVAAWLREDGRISPGPHTTGRRYGAYEVLRPRNWGQVVDVALVWWQDRQRRAAEAPFVPHVDDDTDEPAPPAELAEPVDDAPRVAELLAELAQLVPEVERMAADLAGLPELPDLSARPSIDPERRRVHGQRLLRAELAEAVDRWRAHTSAALSAPSEARPAALYELAAAMARLRELSGLLAR